jgi:cell division protein FtsZ
MSLMQRLAAVGLGRRDEQQEPPPQQQQTHQPMPVAKRPPLRPAPRPPEAPVSEYARRPAPQGLDPHGRPAPVQHSSSEDDQLEIPAFLRRQAN